jgi:hypothetical protein
MKQKKSEMKLPPLDYLLIPTGWKEQREKRANEEKSRRKIKRTLIMDGHDSEEDILYLGKKLKGKEKIGIVTFPFHYLEYKDLIRKAQKIGKFPKGIKLENIETKQTVKQFIYGILGLIEERLDKEINYVKEENKNYYIEEIRYAVKSFLKD